MKLMLITLTLYLMSFKIWSNDDVNLKYQLLAYDDSGSSQNYSNSNEPLSRHEIEDLEYEEDLEYARSRLEDKRIRGEIKGEVTDEMIVDYYNNNFSDY